jgi:hypothetical protein
VTRNVPGGKGKTTYYTFTVTGRVVY